MSASCGLDDCRSACHGGGTAGRYCAPARCYCGGCPAFVELPASPGPMTVDQMEARRQQIVADARRRLAAVNVAAAIDARVAGDRVTFAAAGLVAA